MTENEVRLWEQMTFYDKKHPDSFVANYFFGYNPFGHNPQSRNNRLKSCRFSPAELDNDMLAALIGALSINALGEGTFFGYKVLARNARRSIDACLEGEKQYCEIIMTFEDYNALDREMYD